MRISDRKQYPHLYRKHLRYGCSKEGRRRNRIAVNKYIQTAKGKATRKAYYLSHRNERLAYVRIWKKNLLPQEETKAKAALKNFKGRCHACGTRRSSRKGWHLDHKNRKYRGVLCHSCNVALGFVSDSIPKLKKLIAYLRRTNCV